MLFLIRCSLWSLVDRCGLLLVCCSCLLWVVACCCIVGVVWVVVVVVVSVLLLQFVCCVLLFVIVCCFSFVVRCGRLLIVVVCCWFVVRACCWLRFVMYCRFLFDDNRSVLWGFVSIACCLRCVSLLFDLFVALFVLFAVRWLDVLLVEFFVVVVVGCMLLVDRCFFCLLCDCCVLM